MTQYLKSSYLWAAAIIFYLGTDTATTVYGWQLGLVETNPLFEIGQPTKLIALKVILTGFGILLYDYLPSSSIDADQRAVPLAFATLGLLATTLNTLAILAYHATV
jgi:hypothetical protein